MSAATRATVARPDQQESVLLQGILRRRGDDYLLEERPILPSEHWTIPRIWRVGVAHAAEINFAEYVDREIIVRAFPSYDADHKHMVMRVDSAPPVATASSLPLLDTGTMVESPSDTTDTSTDDVRDTFVRLCGRRTPPYAYRLEHNPVR